MQLETERLILREMEERDFSSLFPIFHDADTMKAYPAPFDEAKMREWIAVNRERYAVFGFGLWAVVLKETGEVIGDCGVTMQRIHGIIRPEIGYHIGKPWQRRGYASEAAACCRDYVFGHTPFQKVYSYMKQTNAASRGVARKNGMHLVEEYDDPGNGRTAVYAIERAEWRTLCGRQPVRRAVSGCDADIDSWMEVVLRTASAFPGLDVQAHRETVLQLMRTGEALCVKEGARVVGVLLLSRAQNMIGCLAVLPECRRQGVASALMDAALTQLDRDRTILVTTFREGDENGCAPRALYARCGFQPGELLEEYGYPVQRFVRLPDGRALGADGKLLDSIDKNKPAEYNLTIR